MSEIMAIILAAGESTRMGKQKLLLPFQGKTIIEKVIKNIEASGADSTFVVVGSHRNDVINVIGRLNIGICYNEDYKQGMLSSVKCGIRSLPVSCEAVLVFPGDQPMIPPTVINKVIHAYINSGKGIVIPTFKKKRGHPLLIDRRYFEEVEKLEEHEGLRALAGKFIEDVLEVETGKNGILKDIDTREEYEEIIKYKKF